MNGNPQAQTIRELGEQRILKLLQGFCPVEMIGDDAAVLLPTPGRSLAVTSDVLVDGVHFSECTTSPEDAGWRAVAANLSDLAATGALPLGITVGLALPEDLPITWVERLYQGMAACLKLHNTPIVGGDVVRSPITTVAITAFGEVDAAHAIRRSTAQPGDAIVVTGYHGSSRGGLELLLHPDQGKSLTPEERAYLIRTHQRPMPRLDVVPLLHSLFPLDSSPLTLTGMDSSDGLADAVIQIGRASGVGARVERSQISIAPALVTWVGVEKALEWALYGGEDFELVLCLPQDAAQILVNQLGKGAAIVGTITAETGIWLVDENGYHPSIPLTLDQGFQHFGG